MLPLNFPCPAAGLLMTYDPLSYINLDRSPNQMAHKLGMSLFKSPQGVRENTKQPTALLFQLRRI